MRISDWSSDVCSSDLRVQLACLEHLHHDVRAADELPFHIKLGDRRPIGEFLDAVSYRRILKHVDRFIFDPQMIENGDRAAGESALRKQRRALHEQQYLDRKSTRLNSSH